MQQIIERLLHQQKLLAEFGSFAFRETSLQSILTEAARVCATSLGAERAKICQYRSAENDLLVVAGYGWNEGMLGQVVSKADKSSPQGRAFITGQPVICSDLTTVKGFELPSFYNEYNIVSTVDVIVKGLDGLPFGILEIDSTTPHEYNDHDVNFLTGFANVLAEAVATAGRNESLRQGLIQKDQLIADKSILAEELQHRVRNNLQLVAGMLAEQARQTSDLQGQVGLRGIQSRVTALAKVYDHLLGIGLSRLVNFGEYLQLLCDGLPDLQVDETSSIVLTCKVAPIMLDLNTVTALGLAVTELVANSYQHAFPNRAGRIDIVGGPANRPNWAELTVSDDGIGYKKTSRESKRHGVGLVYRLMEQVSGSLDVRVAQGTAWTLAFPLAKVEQDQVI